MPFQFTKHYTREEAEALLPQIREWLTRLQFLRQRIEEDEKRLGQVLEASGQDLGGDTVNRCMRTRAELHQVLVEFQQREIQIKDLERGLIDFPAFIAGKEVFLCWEQDEEAIEFWHDLNTGYAGREKL